MIAGGWHQIGPKHRIQLAVGQGSEIHFQRSYYIKIQCASKVHRISVSGHWIWRYSV